MASTTHSWSAQVDSILEDFRITPHEDGSQITRTTTITATKPFQWIKERGFVLGLKRVHCYVFKNWRATLENTR